MPLNNKCLIENVIYKATIDSANESKSYLGSTGGTFKKRWYNHISSFKKYKENGTELSKYIWKLKNNNINFQIDWEIITTSKKSTTNTTSAVPVYTRKSQSPKLTDEST